MLYIMLKPNYSVVIAVITRHQLTSAFLLLEIAKIKTTQMVIPNMIKVSIKMTYIYYVKQKKCFNKSNFVLENPFNKSNLSFIVPK